MTFRIVVGNAAHNNTDHLRISAIKSPTSIGLQSVYDFVPVPIECNLANNSTRKFQPTLVYHLNYPAAAVPKEAAA
jgi:hypothetical protein